MNSIETTTIQFHTGNPDCNIISAHINNDTTITYGVYIKPTLHLIQGQDPAVRIPKNIQTGQEFMEVYTGENYVTTSNKRSYSRLYYSDAIPAKYKQAWQQLKDHYTNNISDEQKLRKTLAPEL